MEEWLNMKKRREKFHAVTGMRWKVAHNTA
jgi:hypothetical protein